MTNLDPDPALQLALIAHRERRYSEAEERYRALLEQKPDRVEAKMMLGILTAQTDREEMAVELLTSVVDQDPHNFEALKWLAGVLSYLKRDAEAEKFAARAVRLKPTDYNAMLNLATALFGLAKYMEAAKLFEAAISVNPQRADAYYGFATTCLRLGDPRRALSALSEAAQINPSTETLLKLGEVALACEDPDEAVRCANRVLESDPSDNAALVLKARAYRNAQNEVEEDRAIEELRRVSPDDQLGHTLYGRRLQSLGRFEEAETEFRRSIELTPNQGIAYYGLTAGRRIVPSDESLVSQMEQVVGDGEMSQDERAHLRFALGKAHDNLGRYGEAMGHFDEGNRLMRDLRMGVRRFDRASETNHVDHIKKLFTKDLLNESLKARREKPDALTPLFIAGIMRSGTTLTEQILSCHPHIGGGGEQSFWRAAELDCVDYAFGNIMRDRIEKRASEYRGRLAEIAPGFPIVTDKNPANRMVYGLIHLAFPDSRIIHMRRHPADVAISIYTTLIRTGSQFMGDRDDIVFALKEHERISRHWKAVLPQDRFLEVDYEDLVRNREAVTRRMVEFCGLDWDDACLHPEANLRTVVTPSFWQVRQPVYTGSLDRWKKYEPWLGAFRALV